MKTRTADEANELRWKTGERGRYEVYYLTFNHLETRTGFWIRYTLTAPDEKGGEPYAQLWFTMFDYDDPANNFGVTKRFPIGELEAGAGPFSLRIGGAVLRSGEAAGAIAGGGHDVRWNLTFTPATLPFLHFPKALYRMEITDTTALSPHLDTRFSGTIEADGRRFVFDGEPGDQTHLWGREHAQRWQWAHCNHFAEDPGAVFELLCAQVKRAGIMLPPLHLLYLKLGDREIQLNNPIDMLTTRGKASPGSWVIRAANYTTRVDFDITCRKADLVEAEYFDPSGERAFCANTEVASSLVKVYTRPSPLVKWSRVETLTSLGTTHVEWGDRKPHQQAANRIELVDE